MAKIGTMLESKYLKQSDVDQDYIVTIAGLEHVNVAAQDADKDEFKWVIRFEEFDKPMVLNSTNIQLLAKACGSDETDDWVGKQVIVYSDPNVSYGGKLVGGLRIKKHSIARPVAPKHRTPAATNRPAAVRSLPSDSEGFADEDIPL